MSLWKNLDWDDWVYGAWVAAGTGASNAVVNGMGLNLIDPKDFNIYTAKFWMAVGAFLVLGGIKDFFLYINKRPAPARIKTKETNSAEVGGVKIKQTIETDAPAPVQPPPKKD